MTKEYFALFFCGKVSVRVYLYFFRLPNFSKLTAETAVVLKKAMINSPNNKPDKRDDATPIASGQESVHDNGNRPDSTKVEREDDDKELLPEDDDDFSETYGDLDGAQETEIVPQPDQQGNVIE